MQQQQQELEQSRINVCFGDDFEDGPTKIKGHVFISEQKALEQYQHIKNAVGEHLDIDWAVVVAQKCLPNQQEALIEAITNIKNRPRFDQFDVKIHSVEDYVYFSVKFKPELEEPFQEQFQKFVEAGLSDLASKQLNYADFDLQANYDFQQVVERMQEGERLGTVILKQTKLELNLFLSKTLHVEVEKILRAIDEEMLESPPMAFIKNFKLIDVDFRFKSTDELPSLIKNQVLFGENFQNQNQQELALPLAQTKQVKKIIESAAENGEIYVTILGTGCLKLEATAPKLSVLLITYGKLLANMLGLGEFIPDTI